MGHGHRIYCSSGGIQAAPAVQHIVQTNTVKGQVVDHQGEPIIGATVKVKGGKSGTVTDLDGNFALKATPGAVIEVSYIGYRTQELKAGVSIFNSMPLPTMLMPTAKPL